jgi:hypothetical protein
MVWPCCKTGFERKVKNSLEDKPGGGRGKKEDLDQG